MSKRSRTEPKTGPLTSAERSSLKTFLKMGLVFMAVVAATSVIAAFVTAWYHGLG
mgnify:CR=1 FL=1